MNKYYTQTIRHIYFILIIPLFCGIFNVANAQWSKSAGGNYTGLCNSFSDSGGSEGGYDVAVDGDGNSYMVGLINSDANFFGTNLVEDGPWGSFITKVDIYGDPVWVRHAVGSHYVTNPSVDIDDDGNVYITGYFDGTANVFGTTLTSSGGSDGYIVKLDSNGSTLWAHKFGGAYSEYIKSIFVDNNDNIYITGSFTSNTNILGTSLVSAGDHDMFILKLDSDGNILWVKRAGGPEYDQVREVAVDSSGNVFLTGFFNGTADIWGTSLVSGGSYDIFLAKLDSNGDGVWAKRGGSEDDTMRDQGDSVDIDSSGNVYVLGRFKDTANIFGQVLSGTTSNNIFITKLDTDGDIDWIKHWTGTSSVYPAHIKVDGANAHITGAFYGTLNPDSLSTTSSGSLDVFLGTINSSDGIATSLDSFGGSSFDSGQSIDISTNGTAYLVGRFKESMTVFGAPLTSSGCYDIFLTQISEGTPPPDRFDGSPSGLLSTGTTTAELQLNTEYDATCGYSTIANTPYASMTTMNTTGTDVHIQSVSGLSNGNTYNYYIRCISDEGTINDDDFEISFSIPDPIIRADVDQNGTINLTDANLTLQNSLGLDMSSSAWVSSATTGDTNCDGNSNSTDAQLILRYWLGLSMIGTNWCE